jgi:hypothetical protein
MRSSVQATTIAAMFFAGVLVGATASAQVDLSGSYAARIHEDWIDRGHGPDVVDYLGLPLNEDGRARALAYTASQLSIPERQCMPYQPQYLEQGPFGFNMWSEEEPLTGTLVAWKISAVTDRAMRTIWMDGRPHPSPTAVHTFAGFSTGVWEGNMLTVYTTHMRTGYLRRNGVPSSDQTTLTEHFVKHGDLLTITAIINDPVYLSEPHVISRTWQIDPTLQQRRTQTPCTSKVEVARFLVTGVVPHYLPGENPYVNEVATMYKLPLEAIMGGATTMYPEYRKKLVPAYTPPGSCARYCCGWIASSTNSGDAPGLNCVSQVRGGPADK